MDVGLNLTHYKNKLTKLTQDEVWVSTKKWVEGGSIYDFWLMKWAGVDAENGDELWWYKTEMPGKRQMIIRWRPKIRRVNSM